MANMNETETETPKADAETLLKRIQKLEEGHANLSKEISKLKSPERGRQSLCLKGGAGGLAGLNLTEVQYLTILQSMGRSVHMFDLNCRIIYWSQMAQSLYGYAVDEALGETAPGIIIGPKYGDLATLIIQRATKGETWSGEFPVRNKRCEKFTVITSLSPLRLDNGTVVAVLCISTDARPFRQLRPQATVGSPRRVSSAPRQPLRTAIASKISNLASKVKSKIKTKENMDHVGRSLDDDYSSLVPCDHRQDALVGGPNTLSGDTTWSPSVGFPDHFTRMTAKDSGGGSENKLEIHKTLSSKAEAWMIEKGNSCAWKDNESDQTDISGHFSWPCLHDDQEHESAGPQTSSHASRKVESQLYKSESASNTNESPWSLSSSCGASSSRSTNDGSIKRFNIDINNLDVDISWDDLMIGEQIGQGSCGTVYHALWYGSDVAVKVLTKQEYPIDAMLSFRKEVSLMKRLRHPNILLFMGAVTSPHHLCIIMEFLPRGSLFQLLRRNTTTLDWKRRVHMAMDIARGMNYLHHCNPPIIHRDLKSSNLLVDKNWTVKVGDFGLSHIKRQSISSWVNGEGTPEWMAPEILRNGKADEKCDVYSYGVVLWEIITEKIPWENLNSMQVIGAVGFMNRRLEIPKDVDPQWACLMERCWSSEPQSRPTFQEILGILKDLQKKLTAQNQKQKG